MSEGFGERGGLFESVAGPAGRAVAHKRHDFTVLAVGGEAEAGARVNRERGGGCEFARLGLYHAVTVNFRDAAVARIGDP